MWPLRTRPLFVLDKIGRGVLGDATLYILNIKALDHVSSDKKILFMFSQYKPK